jgi:hypothetical protein
MFFRITMTMTNDLGLRVCMWAKAVKPCASNTMYGFITSIFKIRCDVVLHSGCDPPHYNNSAEFVYFFFRVLGVLSRK